MQLIFLMLLLLLFITMSQAAASPLHQMSMPQALITVENEQVLLLRTAEKHGDAIRYRNTAGIQYQPLHLSPGQPCLWKPQGSLALLHLTKQASNQSQYPGFHCKGWCASRSPSYRCVGERSGRYLHPQHGILWFKTESFCRSFQAFLWTTKT